jgi:hypothetical protein
MGEDQVRSLWVVHLMYGRSRVSRLKHPNMDGLTPIADLRAFRSPLFDSYLQYTKIAMEHDRLIFYLIYPSITMVIIQIATST